MLQIPELLAPAGDLERLRYAINYGADAVYCGLPEFGMRSAPANFTPEQLAALKGECTIGEAADQVRQASRRYAKRQLTWFRRNRKIHWLIRQEGRSGVEILAAARRFLQENDS